MAGTLKAYCNQHWPISQAFWDNVVDGNMLAKEENEGNCRGGEFRRLPPAICGACRIVKLALDDDLFLMDTVLFGNAMPTSGYRIPKPKLSRSVW